MKRQGAASGAAAVFAVFALVLSIGAILLSSRSEQYPMPEAATNCPANQFAISENNAGGLGCAVLDGNAQLQSVVAVTLAIGTSTTVTLGTAEPDTSYGVVCTPNFLSTLSVTGKTMTSFVINYPAIGIMESADCLIFR